MNVIRALCFFYYLLILPFIILGKTIYWGLFVNTAEKKKAAEKAVLKAAARKGPDELEKLGIVSLDKQLEKQAKEMGKDEIIMEDRKEKLQVKEEKLQVKKKRLQEKEEKELKQKAGGVQTAHPPLSHPVRKYQERMPDENRPIYSTLKNKTSKTAQRQALEPKKIAKKSPHDRGDQSHSYPRSSGLEQTALDIDSLEDRLSMDDMSSILPGSQRSTDSLSMQSKLAQQGSYAQPKRLKQRPRQQNPSTQQAVEPAILAQRRTSVLDTIEDDLPENEDGDWQSIGMEEYYHGRNYDRQQRDSRTSEAGQRESRYANTQPRNYGQHHSGDVDVGSRIPAHRHHEQAAGDRGVYNGRQYDNYRSQARQGARNHGSAEVENYDQVYTHIDSGHSDLESSSAEADMVGRVEQDVGERMPGVVYGEPLETPDYNDGEPID